MSVEALQDPDKEVGRDGVYTALPRPFAWVVGFEHSAVWLGAATGAGYLLVVAVVDAAADLAAEARLAGLTWAHLAAESVAYALYFGGVPIAIAILVRGLERDAQELAPVLGTEKGGGASFYRDVLTVAPRAVWLGGGVGLLLAIATLWVTLGLVESAVGVLFLALREIAIDGAFFGVMGWGVGAALRLSRLTEERAQPDLLDPRSFSALARNGSRLAAVWLVFVAIGVPIGLASPEAVADTGRYILVMTLVLACFAVMALLLPCRGAHRVLRSAKRTELEEVRSQIAEVRRTREDCHFSRA